MRPRFLSLCLLYAITACQVYPASPSLATPLPFILVTTAPNASPTPTPFQPLLPTPTPFQPFLPTPTEIVPPTLTPSLPPPPTTAVDISTLLPTPAPADIIENPSSAPPPMPIQSEQETTNFLLIGSDKRTGSSFRTDTLVIVILRPKEEQVTLISIPRDLWVYIPTLGMQRVNTAYQHGELYNYPGGGPGLLKDTIQYNLGIRIDHTAMVEFDGFRRIVNTLGGIDVPVACAYTDWRLIDPSFDPYNENNWALYTVGAGVVHMDGDLALWYARSRMKSNDFDRGRRQQEVLRTIYTRALQTDILTKIPQLYADLINAVTTDLNLPNLLQLAVLAPRMTNARIRSYYIRPPLVSSWITPLGAYVLLPNGTLLQQMIQEALIPSPRLAERERAIIEVQNGTPFEGWDALAAARLNYAGYEARLAPADRRDYGYSILVDLTTTQDANQSSNILSVLGLYSGSLIPMPDPNSTAGYRVILGYDYQPCFNPENLTP